MSCEKQEELLNQTIQKENQIFVENINFEGNIRETTGYNSLAEMLADGYELAKVETESVALTEEETKKNAKVQNTLTTNITFQDLNNLGYNEWKLRDLVKNQFGHNPDGLSLNSERKFSAPNPTITDRYSHPARMNTGTPNVTTTGQQIGARDLIAVVTLSNYSNQTDNMSFTRTHTSGTTKSWSISQSVSVTIGGKVGIPLISEGSVEVAVGLSASQGSEVTNTISNSVTVSGDVPPNSQRTFYLYAREQEVTASYVLPVYLTGHLGANFGKRVNGHYFWFPTVSSLVGGSRQQIGTVSSRKVLRFEATAGAATSL
ncbi:hypothetical protein V9L05_16750 [Bernardetia sp. Wsw4-3y2]|uniref:hypothetical protein n=1 Tax=Bernardetia sp. Wsw4-3y2 TaxID=3127471 RepID=UPI0030D251B0